MKPTKNAAKEILNIAKYKLQESSKTIVDLKQFQGSVFDRLLSKYRTFMCLNKIQGHNREFKRGDFANLMKNTYNQMMEQYPKGDSKEMINYLATPLLDVYKMSLKSQQLPWKLENNCVSASIVQARVFGEKMSSLHSSRVWYQVTCEYNYETGAKKYHIVEKKVNDPFWRFCYIDQ